MRTSSGGIPTGARVTQNRLVPPKVSALVLILSLIAARLSFALIAALGLSIASESALAVLIERDPDTVQHRYPASRTANVMQGPAAATPTVPAS